MKARFEAWRASFREQRIAALVAGVCLALIVILGIRPDLMRPAHTPTEKPQPAQIPEPSPTDGNPVPMMNKPETSGQPVMRETTPRATMGTSTDRSQLRPAKPSQQAPGLERKSPEPTPPGYYIQVGAFSDARRAHALQRKILRHDWPARIIEKEAGLMAVVIGPYGSHREATGKQQEILRTFKLKGYPIQYAPTR